MFWHTLLLACRGGALTLPQRYVTEQKRITNNLDHLRKWMALFSEMKGGSMPLPYREIAEEPLQQM